MTEIVHIQPTVFADCREMAALLNQIITAGGTTAITRPVTASDLGEWMSFAPDRAAWHCARNESGTLLGFQWIEPFGKLPSDTADIATFVKTGQTGLGVGSRLFEATKNVAREIGYNWINAVIRADNQLGLAYYQSRGFRGWSTEQGVALDDGTQVDKVLMRYDLWD